MHPRLTAPTPAASTDKATAVSRLNPRVTQVLEALLPAGQQRESVAAILEKDRGLYLLPQAQINRAVMAAIKAARRLGLLRTPVDRTGSLKPRIQFGSFKGDRRVT